MPAGSSAERDSPPYGPEREPAPVAERIYKALVEQMRQWEEQLGKPRQ